MVRAVVPSIWMTLDALELSRGFLTAITTRLDLTIATTLKMLAFPVKVCTVAVMHIHTYTVYSVKTNLEHPLPFHVFVAFCNAQNNFNSTKRALSLTRLPTSLVALICNLLMPPDYIYHYDVA